MANSEKIFIICVIICSYILAVTPCGWDRRHDSTNRQQIPQYEANFNGKAQYHNSYERIQNAIREEDISSEYIVENGYNREYNLIPLQVKYDDKHNYYEAFLPNCWSSILVKERDDNIVKGTNSFNLKNELNENYKAVNAITEESKFVVNYHSDRDNVGVSKTEYPNKNEKDNKNIITYYLGGGNNYFNKANVDDTSPLLNSKGYNVNNEELNSYYRHIPVNKINSAYNNNIINTPRLKGYALNSVIYKGESQIDNNFHTLNAKNDNNISEEPVDAFNINEYEINLNTDVYKTEIGENNKAPVPNMNTESNLVDNYLRNRDNAIEGYETEYSYIDEKSKDLISYFRGRNNYVDTATVDYRNSISNSTENNNINSIINPYYPWKKVKNNFNSPNYKFVINTPDVKEDSNFLTSAYLHKNDNQIDDIQSILNDENESNSVRDSVNAFNVKGYEMNNLDNNDIRIQLNGNKAAEVKAITEEDSNLNYWSERGRGGYEMESPYINEKSKDVNRYYIDRDNNYLSKASADDKSFIQTGNEHKLNTVELTRNYEMYKPYDLNSANYNYLINIPGFKKDSGLITSTYPHKDDYVIDDNHNAFNTENENNIMRETAKIFSINRYEMNLNNDRYKVKLDGIDKTVEANTVAEDDLSGNNKSGVMNAAQTNCVDYYLSDRDKTIGKYKTVYPYIDEKGDGLISHYIENNYVNKGTVDDRSFIHEGKNSNGHYLNIQLQPTYETYIPDNNGNGVNYNSLYNIAEFKANVDLNSATYLQNDNQVDSSNNLLNTYNGFKSNNKALDDRELTLPNTKPIPEVTNVLDNIKDKAYINLPKSVVYAITLDSSLPVDVQLIGPSESYKTNAHDENETVICNTGNQYENIKTYVKNNQNLRSAAEFNEFVKPSISLLNGLNNIDSIQTNENVKNANEYTDAKEPFIPTLRGLDNAEFDISNIAGLDEIGIHNVSHMYYDNNIMEDIVPDFNEEGSQIGDVYVAKDLHENVELNRKTVVFEMSLKLNDILNNNMYIFPSEDKSHYVVRYGWMDHNKINTLHNNNIPELNNFATLRDGLLTQEVGLSPLRWSNADWQTSHILKNFNQPKIDLNVNTNNILNTATINAVPGYTLISQIPYSTVRHDNCNSPELTYIDNVKPLDYAHSNNYERSTLYDLKENKRVSDLVENAHIEESSNIDYPPEEFSKTTHKNVGLEHENKAEITFIYSNEEHTIEQQKIETDPVYLHGLEENNDHKDILTVNNPLHLDLVNNIVSDISPTKTKQFHNTNPVFEAKKLNSEENTFYNNFVEYGARYRPKLEGSDDIYGPKLKENVDNNIIIPYGSVINTERDYYTCFLSDNTDVRDTNYKYKSLNTNSEFQISQNDNRNEPIENSEEFNEKHFDTLNVGPSNIKTDDAEHKLHFANSGEIKPISNESDIVSNKDYDDQENQPNYTERNNNEALVEGSGYIPSITDISSRKINKDNVYGELKTPDIQVIKNTVGGNYKYMPVPEKLSIDTNMLYILPTSNILSQNINQNLPLLEFELKIKNHEKHVPQIASDISTTHRTPLLLNNKEQAEKSDVFNNPQIIKLDNDKYYYLFDLNKPDVESTRDGEGRYSQSLLLESEQSSPQTVHNIQIDTKNTPKTQSAHTESIVSVPNEMTSIYPESVNVYNEPQLEENVYQRFKALNLLNNIENNEPEIVHENKYDGNMKNKETVEFTESDKKYQYTQEENGDLAGFNNVYLDLYKSETPLKANEIPHISAVKSQETILPSFVPNVLNFVDITSNDTPTIGGDTKPLTEVEDDIRQLEMYNDQATLLKSEEHNAKFEANELDYSPDLVHMSNFDPNIGENKQKVSLVRPLNANTINNNFKSSYLDPNSKGNVYMKAIYQNEFLKPLLSTSDFIERNIESPSSNIEINSWPFNYFNQDQYLDLNSASDETKPIDLKPSYSTDFIKTHSLKTPYDEFINYAPSKYLKEALYSDIPEFIFTNDFKTYERTAMNEYKPLDKVNKQVDYKYMDNPLNLIENKYLNKKITSKYEDENNEKETIDLKDTEDKTIPLNLDLLKDVNIYPKTNELDTFASFYFPDQYSVLPRIEPQFDFRKTIDLTYDNKYIKPDMELNQELQRRPINSENENDNLFMTMESHDLNQYLENKSIYINSYTQESPTNVAMEINKDIKSLKPNTNYIYEHKPFTLHDSYNDYTCIKDEIAKDLSMNTDDQYFPETSDINNIYVDITEKTLFNDFPTKNELSSNIKTTDLNTAMKQNDDGFYINNQDIALLPIKYEPDNIQNNLPQSNYQKVETQPTKISYPGLNRDSNINERENYSHEENKNVPLNLIYNNLEANVFDEYTAPDFTIKPTIYNDRIPSDEIKPEANWDNDITTTDFKIDSTINNNNKDKITQEKDVQQNLNNYYNNQPSIRYLYNSGYPGVCLDSNIQPSLNLNPLNLDTRFFNVDNNRHFNQASLVLGPMVQTSNSFEPCNIAKVLEKPSFVYSGLEQVPNTITTNKPIAFDDVQAKITTVSETQSPDSFTSISTSPNDDSDLHLASKSTPLSQGSISKDLPEDYLPDTLQFNLNSVPTSQDIFYNIASATNSPEQFLTPLNLESPHKSSTPQFWTPRYNLANKPTFEDSVSTNIIKDRKEPNFDSIFYNPYTLKTPEFDFNPDIVHSASTISDQTNYWEPSQNMLDNTDFLNQLKINSIPKSEDIFSSKLQPNSIYPWYEYNTVYQNNFKDIKTLPINENILNNELELKNILNDVQLTSNPKIIPLGQFINPKEIAYNFTITEPDLDLYGWYSKVKVIKATLILQADDACILNFRPILKSNFDPQEVQNKVINLLQRYGKPVIINEVNSEYFLEDNLDFNERFYLLWPAYREF